MTKLISMILRRQLPLVRLDTLQDKFEGLHGRNYAAAWHESHKHMLTAAGDYVDDIAYFYGKHRLYRSRHLDRAFDEVVTALRPLI